MEKNGKEYPIRVSAKIIADISAGIYRTPANALKELVSNAFDADAETVILTTDAPEFSVFTCSDNGKGITSKDFQKIMTRIGGTDKRDEKDKTESGRPIIGKIGIGLLAIAQICRKFTVISSIKGSPHRFEAIVDLKPFFDINTHKFDLIDIGKFDMYEEIPEKLEDSYTRIIMENIDQGFRKRLRDPEISIDGFKWKKGNPQTFGQFVDWVKNSRIRELSEYDRMIWELAMICPVKYLDDGPIKGYDVIPEIKQRLQKYDFTVIVNGIELRKPILFPTDDEIISDPEDFHVYLDIEHTEKIGNRILHFNGYIYHQRKAIWPPELRGILPRIREVAIGDYDKTLFNYPRSEGPIMEQFSGEIYINQGIEEALNIDRNSFRESDEAYVRLQEYLFEKLGGSNGITRDVRTRSKKRNLNVKKAKRASSHKETEKAIKKIIGKKFLVIQDGTKNEIPITIDIKKHTIKVFDNPIFPKKKKEREILENTLILFEISKALSKNMEDLSEKFYELLKGRKW